MTLALHGKSKTRQGWLIAIGVAVVALATVAGGTLRPSESARSAAPPAAYFNGFEDTNDTSPPALTADHAMSNVTRVPTGTGGIASAAGGWHALSATNAFAFTRYGGYSSIFPAGGYTTSIDIYLDTAESPTASDIQFDWSSAINDTTGLHRRDFIFSVGANGTGGFVMTASNNSPGWPANPLRDPYTITTTGWYTFQHTFRDDGGVLAVDMSVLSGATVLKSWTLSEPSDVIGTTVGGNRYGWMVGNEFTSLALDNITRSGEPPQPETADECKKDGWLTLFRADGSAFKNQGDCVSYVNTGK